MIAIQIFESPGLVAFFISAWATGVCEAAVDVTHRQWVIPNLDVVSF